MTDSRALLERIRIATPCDAEWDRMTGTDRIRFCEHCNLSVRDVSAMTRREAEALVRASKGRLCLRFHRDETGRVRTLDAPPVVSITRRASRIAAGAMALAFAAGGAAPAAQGRALVRPPSAAARSEEPTGGGRTISGVVRDAQGAVVAGATVTLLGGSGGETRTVATDYDGRFSFDVGEGAYELAVEGSGFAKTVVEGISVHEGGQYPVEVTLEVAGTGALLGVVAIASPADDLVSHSAEREAMHVEDPKLPPIVDALYNGGVDSIREAIRTAGDVDGRGTFGETALMLELADKAHAKALLAAGADVNARDSFGVTALMRAALDSDPRSVKRLLAAGADVNVGDKDGLTALMVAAFAGNGATVRALLRAGADVRARDSRGKTVLTYARESEQVKVVALLEAAGAVE